LDDDELTTPKSALRAGILIKYDESSSPETKVARNRQRQIQLMPLLLIVMSAHLRQRLSSERFMNVRQNKKGKIQLMMFLIWE